MIKGRKGFGPWSEIGGWTLALIVLVVILFVVVLASRSMDISFLQRIGG